MRSKKILAVVSAVLALVMLAGCGSPEASSEEMIRTGIKNFWNNVNSGNLQSTVQLAADITQDGKKDEISGNIAVAGKYSKKNKQDPRMDIDLSGDIIYQGIKYTGQLLMKAANKKVYLNLLKYPIEANQQNPQLVGMLASLANKWYFIDGGKYSQSALLADESKMTPEQKQIEEEFFKTNFFKNIKYEGKEKVGEINAYKYNVVFDNDAFVQFAVKASEINKKPATEQEVADLKKEMAKINFSGDILVSVDTETLIGSKAALIYKDPDAKTNVTVNFDIKITDINKEFTVEEPSGAIDLMKMFGG